MRVKVDPARVKEVFGKLKDQAAFAESRQLLEAGKLPVEMLQAMTLRPDILKAFAATGEGVYPGGLLERRLKEKVILKASIDNNCQFCRDSHRALMSQLGIPQGHIDDLQKPAHLTEREGLALQYTAAVMQDSNHVSDALFAKLHARFTDPQIVELTFLIGFINMLNLFNNALQVTFHQEYP